ncbi:MAG: septal ring lytic transglycosylase RlpA family protein [Acidobacteria bacterium]|nr:septal ring lytic transglycosylase RlpA family protein [Acidobacteriota bacterium]
MRRRFANSLALAVCIASLTAGAAGGPNSSEAGKTHVKPKAQQIRKARAKRASAPYQVGIASWYGEYFQGKETASGEPYDMHDLTAAHPSLPLGTFLKVTNLSNGRSVVLRVNDRGPMVQGRIIDVSYSAARVLGFKAQGLERVRLDLVPVDTLAMARPPRLP